MTANDSLTGLNPRWRRRFSWTRKGDLLTSLGNQAYLVANFDKFEYVFGWTGPYSAHDPVQRAIIAELESSIKVGDRPAGTVVTANDSLTGLNPPVAATFSWTRKEKTC